VFYPKLCSPNYLVFRTIFQQSKDTLNMISTHTILSKERISKVVESESNFQITETISIIYFFFTHPQRFTNLFLTDLMFVLGNTNTTNPLDYFNRRAREVFCWRILFNSNR